MVVSGDDDGGEGGEPGATINMPLVSVLLLLVTTISLCVLVQGSATSSSISRNNIFCPPTNTTTETVSPSSSCRTLTDLFGEMKRRIPISIDYSNEAAHSYYYVIPTEENKVDYEQIVYEMMMLSSSSSSSSAIHENNGKTHCQSTTRRCHQAHKEEEEEDQQHLQHISKCNEIDLRSLAAAYDVGVFVAVDEEGHHDDKHGESTVDNDLTKKYNMKFYYYCVLMTKSVDHPWGNVIVNLNSEEQHHSRTTNIKNISIDIPHPIYDTNTGEQGLAVFQYTNSRSFIVSGAYRYSIVGQTVDSSSNSSSFWFTDAAHSTVGTCLTSATKGIMKYYNNNNDNNNIHIGDYTSIQFHGMGNTTCPNVDIFMTDGTKTVSSKKIQLLQMELDGNLNSFQNSGSVGDSTSGIPSQRKTFNVLVPGIDDTSDGGSRQEEKPEATTTPAVLPPKCNLYGTTNIQGQLINNSELRNRSGRFIHIEQKYDLRQPSLYNVWIQSINNMYNQYYFDNDDDADNENRPTEEEKEVITAPEHHQCDNDTNKEEGEEFSSIDGTKVAETKKSSTRGYFESLFEARHHQWYLS